MKGWWIDPLPWKKWLGPEPNPDARKKPKIWLDKNAVVGQSQPIHVWIRIHITDFKSCVVILLHSWQWHQCCAFGSGSARIGIIWPDPDPHLGGWLSGTGSIKKKRNKNFTVNFNIGIGTVLSKYWIFDIYDADERDKNFFDWHCCQLKTKNTCLIFYQICTYTSWARIRIRIWIGSSNWNVGPDPNDGDLKRCMTCCLYVIRWRTSWWIMWRFTRSSTFSRRTSGTRRP